ncbi:complement C1q tumor necrosis factor-related protein 2-like [Hypanus sabinus]|uniref:complement C1q tumor necrosis factor-related protein 2-like n=1 Tax=Hypanus sabinus TaxID=79690 RepID=UPI0028C3CF5B|nr:complement C1q tumor necrosis factor-related protein 2-like [Hypanus sabinus]
MLYTLVVVLSVLAWRIQAQNGTSSESIGNLTSMDNGELGSSEHESEDLTTAFSLESESTSSDPLTTTPGGFQVNEGSMPITTVPLRLATPRNDGSLEAGQTSFTESDVNGLADISNENTVTERPDGSPESEDSHENESDEMKSPGSSRDNSGKKGSLHGRKALLRDKRRISEMKPRFPLEGTNSYKGNPVTEMSLRPRTTQPPISEEMNDDITNAQAFSVGLFGKYQIPVNGTPVLFERIFFNEAQLYHLKTGKFVAKSDGIYSLTYSVISSLKQKQVDLIINGVPIISNFGEEWKENNDISASLIMHLKSRDEIWFEIVDGDPKEKYNIMFTFSGFLLSR